MRNRRSQIALLVVSAFLLIGASTSTAAIQSGAASPRPPKLTWSPCFQEFGAFECATAQVPLEYDRKGGSTPVALARLPATDPTNRIGSLFVNPGGPGGSGVDFVLFAGPFLFSDEVRASFDIVGFDPRGIHRSAGLRCFASPDKWGPFFTPFAFPMTAEEEAIWAESDQFVTDACERRGRRIMDHMSTANVARDLDLLRAAVGDDQLTYVGYSYGSFLGVTYANLFPDKVRAVVVDGVLDPIAWTTGVGNEADTIPVSTRLRSDAGAQATLEEFFRLCDAGSACAFGPDSANRFADLAETLLAGPIEVPFPDGSSFLLDYSGLIAITLGGLYDSFSWEGLAQFLADVEAGASPAALAPRVKALLQRPAYMVDRGFASQYPNDLEGFPGVLCSDSDNPGSYADWSAAGIAADAAFGYFGRIWTWASSICVTWPGADSDRYTGPFTATTANPVLVVGTRFDPATPYQGAQTVAGLLPNSSLLTVNGWGHTSIFLSQCADQIVTDYLLTVATPAPGTTCDQDFTPFG
jgi:pimeloyl-ACP methyl ester carboxylesterase